MKKGQIFSNIKLSSVVTLAAFAFFIWQPELESVLVFAVTFIGHIASSFSVSAREGDSRPGKDVTELADRLGVLELQVRNFLGATKR